MSPVIEEEPGVRPSRFAREQIPPGPPTQFSEKQTSILSLSYSGRTNCSLQLAEANRQNDSLGRSIFPDVRMLDPFSLQGRSPD